MTVLCDGRARRAANSAVAALLVVHASQALLQAAPVSPSPVAAVRVERPPRLDGTLADPVWTGAAVVTDLVQREPHEGQAATERTVVSVLYDSTRLYFGVRCLDSQPQRIVATELRRDTDASVDDSITLLMSPTNDGRNGYEFTVNPLGTQFDALVADEGRVKDPSWDGIWESKATRTSEGWAATIAIPFSTLNFKASAHPVLGFNVRRFIRRENEEDLWRAWQRVYGLERISQGGQLGGLHAIGSGRLLVVKPFVVGGVDATPLGPATALHRAGADVKYGVRSGLVANATVNTDFADADVDPLRFNITPFKVLLPEKRPFFLENGAFFQFGEGDSQQLFFSRQIGIDPEAGQEVPIDGGLKLTGTMGSYDVGVLDARTRQTGTAPWANYLVARVKRRLLDESYVGAVAIDKRSGDPADRSNGAVGVDANFRFFKALNLRGYYARTASSRADLAGRNAAGAIAAAYTGDFLEVGATRSEVQPHFNPEAGFFDRVDVVTNYAAVAVKPRPRKGPFRQLQFIAAFTGQPDTAGTLQTQQWQATVITLFHSGAYTNNDLVFDTIQRLGRPFNIFGDVVIPAGEYHFRRHQIQYNSDPGRPIYYTIDEKWGPFYDGSLNELTGTATLRPAPRISVTAAETWNRFVLAGRLHHVLVGSLSASYSFSRFVTTSLLLQADTVDRTPISANWRLRWQYRPDSDLFVIWNIGPQFGSLSQGNPILTRDRRVSVKWTYSLAR